MRIPYGPDAAIYDFDAIIPILIADFTSELSDTDEKLRSKVRLAFCRKQHEDSRAAVAPAYSATNSIPPFPDGSLDTQVFVYAFFAIKT